VGCGSVADPEQVRKFLELLRCPSTGQALELRGGSLLAVDAGHSYSLAEGIPLFAETSCSGDALRQQQHYEAIAGKYITNLNYPHTKEYTAFLDRALLQAVEIGKLSKVAEICCGRGEAFHLLADKIGLGVGIDISLSMLKAARRENSAANLLFAQGDATNLPLANDAFDSVFMLGGIHHVSGRAALFAEVARILKPGGAFYYREPVNDFLPWRAIRSVVYRLSPTLDHVSERPLRLSETVPVLEQAGLVPAQWKTFGFLGFCLFMNSDVLVFNRLFRFVPGIRAITRWSTRLDDWIVSLPGMQHAGLQVVGVARKPARPAL